MRVLADIYMQSNPEKALALINEMDEQSDSDWKLRKQIANVLIEVNDLEQKRNYQEAASKLDGVELPLTNDISDFVLTSGLTKRPR